MNPGRLNQKLLLQSKTEIVNDIGEATIDWTTFAMVWGQIIPTSGREYLQNQERAGEITARIIIRYREDLKAENRIVCGADVYDVNSIININNKKQYLELLCTRTMQ